MNVELDKAIRLYDFHLTMGELVAYDALNR